MEFRPSATLHGVHLFDGSSERRESFAIGHCKGWQERVKEKYGMNGIIPFTPFQNTRNADFRLQIIPLRFY